VLKGALGKTTAARTYFVELLPVVPTISRPASTKLARIGGLTSERKPSCFLAFSSSPDSSSSSTQRDTRGMDFHPSALPLSPTARFGGTQMRLWKGMASAFAQKMQSRIRDTLNWRKQIRRGHASLLPTGRVLPTDRMTTSHTSAAPSKFWRPPGWLWTCGKSKTFTIIWKSTPSPRACSRRSRTHLERVPERLATSGLTILRSRSCAWSLDSPLWSATWMPCSQQLCATLWFESAVG
jgi:hypothetical protein